MLTYERNKLSDSEAKELSNLQWRLINGKSLDVQKDLERAKELEKKEMVINNKYEIDHYVCLISDRTKTKRLIVSIKVFSHVFFYELEDGSYHFESELASC